jgi:hypothetical protein
MDESHEVFQWFQPLRFVIQMIPTQSRRAHLIAIIECRRFVVEPQTLRPILPPYINDAIERRLARWFKFSRDEMNLAHLIGEQETLNQPCRGRKRRNRSAAKESLPQFCAGLGSSRSSGRVE